VLHSQMNKQVLVIESQDKFNAWYHAMQIKNAHVSNALPTSNGSAINLAGGNPGAGQTLFQQKCSACHSTGPFDQRIVGPGLKAVLHDPGHPNLVNGDPASPANVAKILQTGYTGSIGTMPNATTNGLSDQDIANLVAYLSTLK
jgi:mono/diheme cytochrome c family protein